MDNKVLVPDQQLYTTITWPKYVGAWDISGGEGTFVVQMKKKPNWFVRTMTTLILGWKWKDL